MKKVEKETTVPDLIESSGFKVRFLIKMNEQLFHL